MRYPITRLAGLAGLTALVCCAPVMAQAVSGRSPARPLASQALAGAGYSVAQKIAPVSGGLAGLGGTRWPVRLSPSPGRLNNLVGVRALSAADAWAVGTYCRAQCQRLRTLTLHWDGTAWSQVAAPNPGSAINILQQLAPVSANDVWAVGYDVTKTGHTSALVLHWNGTAWSAASGPAPGHEHALIGAATVSASNIWAAGWSCVSACTRSSQVTRTLIMHWNGTAWSSVPSPSPGSRRNLLIGMSAVSATNIWAVGEQCSSRCAAVAQGEHPLILHWNGTRWSAAKVPAAKNAVLEGVAAPAASSASAVGYRCTSSCSAGYGTGQTYVLHWNGGAWSTVASPSPGNHANVLGGVFATSPNNAWASGYYCVSACTTSNETDHTLLLHWNGTRWSRTAAPNPAGTSNWLIDTGAESATDAWAVGTSQNAHGQDTLILHWNGTTWSVS